jgi:hypothetical protein
VKRGDFACCEHRSFYIGYRNPGCCPHNDHILIYYGDNKFLEATAIFPFLYKGSNGWDICKLGVLKTSFLFLNLWATNIVFGTVRNATEGQRDNAVKWAEKQLGQPYQYTRYVNWPFSEHKWWACSNRNGTMYNPDTGEYFQEKFPDYFYCTELVWAAYKHCNGDTGLDLAEKWELDIKDNSWHWCSTPDYWLSDYENIYLYTDGDYGYPGDKEPIVESYNVDVGKNNATLFGKLIDDGNERCHCFITLIGVENRYCGFYTGKSTDTFKMIFKHLEPDTTYQWYAWSYNSFGEVYGETKSFTTLP